MNPNPHRTGATIAVLAMALVPLFATAEMLAMPVSYGAVAGLPAPESSARLAYGDDPLQTVLRFDPAEVPRADIALVHGGCWSADYDRAHTLPLAAALRDAGFRVWVPEYRRVGDQGGGWPGTWEDIETALALIAGHNKDAPLVAVGHSAGGHLALFAATREDTPLTATIALAPITDVGAYAAGEGSCQAMATRLMGAPLEGNESVYEAASPAFLENRVPAIVIQGAADPIVPMTQATAMAGATVVVVPEAGHFDLIHPQTQAFVTLLEQLAVVTQ